MPFDQDSSGVGWFKTNDNHEVHWRPLSSYNKKLSQEEIGEFLNGLVDKKDR